MVGIYELAHVRSVFHGLIQFDNFKFLGSAESYEIQYSDFAIASIISAVQFGMYIFQL